MAVTIEAGPAFSASAPRALFDGPYVDFLGLNYDISPDGRRFLMVKDASSQSSSAGLIGVFNWTADVKARMAAK